MKLSNQLVPLETLVLAAINDHLATLVWMKTKDGQKGRNRPTSISSKFSTATKQERKEVVFTSGEEFEQTRLQLLSAGGEE